MIIDSSTGLPKLPEGWYFKTTKAYSGASFYWMQICRTEKRRRFFFWTREVEVKLIFQTSISYLTKDLVYQAACTCYRQWKNWQETDMKFLGKFPPKSVDG